MHIIFLILNEFSCGKVEKTLNLFPAAEYLSVFMLRTVQLALVISTLVISNYRLSQRENLIPVLT